MAAILLYHAVAEVVIDPALQVRATTIDRHLGWCLDLGWEIAPLADVLANSAAKLVAVTFDDGLASIAGTLPTLADRGAIPTVFLCPGMLGRENDWRSPGRVRERLLGADDLPGLRREGVEFGVHGWDHRAFVSRPYDHLMADLAACRAWFRSTFSEDPSVFAWPFGRFDDAALDAVGREFRHALAVEPPWGEDVSALAIPRVAAAESMTFDSFADALELASFVLDSEG